MRTMVVLAASAMWLSGCVCGPGDQGRNTRSGASEAGGGTAPSGPAAPLAIGVTFTVRSRVLAEDRRVNVFVPTLYGEPFEEPLPVLYMPDGGLDEDFLHVAGLVQVLVSNGGMRPFVLVGIPNTQRRRDLTGPTTREEDLAIAPQVGGSAAYRSFLRDELMPEIRRRYHTTDEAAIVGESLAGLFVVETYFVEPGMFREYIAIDPSLWWAGGALVRESPGALGKARPEAALFVATSSEPEMARLGGELARAFEGRPERRFVYAPMPTETHATIYHPAALRAFREILAPPAEAKRE